MTSSLYFLFANQYSLGGGFSFPIVLVPRYKLSLCHTPIKPDLLGFRGIGVFAYGLCDHEVRINHHRLHLLKTRYVCYHSQFLQIKWCMLACKKTKRKHKANTWNCQLQHSVFFFILAIYEKDDEQCEGNLITFALFMHGRLGLVTGMGQWPSWAG